VQINSMTIPEILKALDTYTGRFPMQAMRAAIEQREAITSELLRVVETVAENSEHYSRREGHMVHVFALYLLAQFREKRAYPFVIKMFSAPGETPFELAGDTVTEGLNRIFASVYDGNPSPLQELFENEAANEYVRNAAIDAFVVLAHTGQMTREAVVAYFTSLFHGRLKRTYSHAWDGLVVAVADLPAPELLEDVRRAYADDLVDPGFAHLEGIERILREQERGGGKGAVSSPMPSPRWNGGNHSRRPGGHPQKRRRADNLLPSLATHPHSRRFTKSLGATHLVPVAAARNTSIAVAVRRPNRQIIETNEHK
jgi:hypothetical protein